MLFKRVLTIVTVFYVVICLTSCKESSSTTSENQSMSSASEPMVRSTPPAVGETAPDFTLSTPAQTSISLADQLAQGPVVLVVLRGWPGYQCPICTRQVGQFIGQAKKLKAAGAHVVLVYPGPAERLNEHAREFIADSALPSNFTFVIDPDYSFTNSYALRWDAPRETAYPSTFVIDPQGKIHFAKVSDSHGGRANVTEVLNALAALKG